MVSFYLQVCRAGFEPFRGADLSLTFVLLDFSKSIPSRFPHAEPIGVARRSARRSDRCTNPPYGTAQNRRDYIEEQPSHRRAESFALPPPSPCFQHIPDPPDIVNKGLVERIVDLRSQATHRRFNNIRARIEVDIPNLFDNSRAGDNFARRLR